jgi:gamma-glutamyltranspeptidase/glutathione hydrolase
MVLAPGCHNRRPAAPTANGQARETPPATPLATPAAPAARTAESKSGMVVSVSGRASEAGRDVLRDGGNAVDAAVATAFALAVTFPEAGNIGGGGFMLVHPGRGAVRGGSSDPVVIDYRETAPAGATRDMFAGANPPSSEALVGVPGTVRGLALAHERFGRLPWARLVAPAAALARDGFEIDADLAEALNKALARAADFPEFRRVYGKSEPDPQWRAGDRLVQPDLAGTLDLIAAGGPGAFYAGDVARQLVATVRDGPSRGGVLAESDLTAYEAKVRAPVHGTYRGYDVYAPPPPSSGGVALVEMLNVLETFDLRHQGRWSPRTLHVIVEAMRRAFFDRARFLGDADFVNVPVAQLASKDYAKEIAADINPAFATSSLHLAMGGGITVEDAGPREGAQTTHFSVIDADGMAVSNTYTLEQSFGGMLVVKGYGFLLNNEMGDFNPRPGHTDRTGRIGTRPNVVEPGKRMLSSMCPTIVAKDGRVVLVTGSPGGRTIINTVLCVVLNVLEFGMPLREAVDAPRLHHQWLPDGVRVEPGLQEEHAEAVESLRQMGHTIDEQSPKQGDAHSIQVMTDGSYVGVADGRRSGGAAGL